MEQNKYFTPDIEDLHVGYECEVMTSWAPVKGEWPDVLLADTLSGFAFNQLKTPSDIVKIGEIRTKYLDRADIESLGWKWFTNASYGEDYEMINNGKKYVLSQIENTQEIYVYLIEKSEDYTIFNGQCKSINELRIIHKLLQIK